MRYIKNFSVVVLCASALMLVLSEVACADQQKYQNFNWKSPNGWEGGIFDVPTWFAKDMLYTGREVIRFHDGFYDKQSTGFWTYAFVLLVEQTQAPTTEALVDETERYFTGLARELGDRNDPSWPRDKIRVKPVSERKVDGGTKQLSQRFQLEVFDSFTTGKPLVLNVKITSWLCSDNYRAIHYALSPHELVHPIWEKLDKEVSAVKCW